MDRKFRRERVYPYLREAATFFPGVTLKGPDEKGNWPLALRLK